MNFLKTHKYSLIILVFLTFLAYINIYQNDFLSDDLDGIVNNIKIGNLGQSTGSLVDIINSLTFSIFGLSKPAFHFTNVLFHALNAVTIYILLTQIKTAKSRLALPTALFFAVHPIHTEVVTWISGRPYAVFSFFTLLSLLLFILYLNKSKLLYLILSLCSYLLALFTSEKAIVLSLFIIFYLISFNNLKKYLKPLSFYILITGLYGLTLLTKFSGRVSAVNPSYIGSPIIYNPLFQIPTAVSSYIELFIFPLNLTLYHSSIITNSQFAVKAVITIVFLLSTVFFFKKSKLLFFASCLFILSLIPYLLPVSIAWIVAERYVYLGSLGLTIIFVWLIFKLGDLLKLKKLPFIIFISLTTIYLFLTIQRNREWQSQDTLWPATIKQSVDIPVAHNNMGDYYARHGDYQNAIIEFSTAVNMQNGIYPEAMHNLANMYLSINEATRAAILYEKVITQNPNIYQTYVQLGKTYFILKDYKKALEVFQKALLLYPNDPGLLNAINSIKSIKN